MDYFVTNIRESLRQILSDQSSPVMAMDADMRIVFANTAWLNASRRTWDDVSETHYFEVFDIDRANITKLALKMRRARAGKVSRFKIGEDGMPHTPHCNAPIRWNARQQPVRGEADEVEYIVQVLRPEIPKSL